MLVNALFSGAKGLLDVVDSIGLEAGKALEKVTERKDKERIQRAEKAMLNESRTQRKKTTMTKVRQEEELTREEGLLYDAGAY